MAGTLRSMVLLPALALAAAGCVLTGGNGNGAPIAGYDAAVFTREPAQPEPDVRPPEPSEAASLWVPNQRNNYLLSNHKAFQVNDVVTVQIVESTQGSKNANTKTKRESGMAAGIDGLFGFENTLPLLAPNLNMSTMVGGKTQSDFDASGQTTRNEKLVGTVTALVTDVLPNGNLVIEGKRRVQVNEETQIMVVRGIVRPRDIDADNTIMSTQIADAEIYLVGEGVLSEKQKPGWLTRGVDQVWPF